MKTGTSQNSKVRGSLLLRALAAVMLVMTFALMPHTALADEGAVLAAQSEATATSVEFVPVEPLVLTSGKEGCIVDEGDGGSGWEYFEYLSFPREGDVLLFSMDDGTSETYTFTRVADKNGFYNEDGMSLGDFSWEAKQSRDNEWSPDNPGTILMNADGLSCTYQVQILPNPVESIAFEPQAPYVLKAGVDGAEETGVYGDSEITWFRYEEPQVQDGETLTVNLTNGSVHTYHFDGDHEGFVSDDDPADVIPFEEEGNGGFSFWGNQSAFNQWAVDNPGIMKLTYYGRSVAIPVTIAVSLDPIDDPEAWSMSYEPVSQPLEVGVEDMYLTWDGDVPYMTYNLPQQTGDVLVFKRNDGEGELRYRLDYQEDGTGTFTNVNDPEDTIEQYSVMNSWLEAEQKFQLEYWLWETTLDVTINNHVTGIAYMPAEPFVFLEGNSSETTDYIYDDEDNETEVTYGIYRIMPNTGDALVVTYDDGTQRTFTASWDDGLVYRDADGEALPGDVYDTDDQSYEHQWGVGEHTVTFWYAGCTCPVTVTVEANSVQSISYDARKTTYVEGTSGWEETGENAPYYVYAAHVSTGDLLTVNFTDGASAMYRFDPMKGTFCNVDDPEDSISMDDVYTHSDQSEDNPWGPGMHEFIVSYHGRECTYAVEVVANDVASIAFEQVHPFMFVEGRDGTQHTDPAPWIFYPPSTTPGDRLIVTTKSGRVKTYVYQMPGDGSFQFVNEADSSDIIPADDIYWGGYRYGQTLAPGNHTYTLHYCGASCEVPVTIVPDKAPSSISLANQTKVYNSKAQAYSGKVTKSGSSGNVSYAYYSDAACKKPVAAANVKNVGTYYVKATVAADENYLAATSAPVKLTITKAAQPMTAKGKSATIKSAQLNKKKQVLKVSQVLTVKKAQGSVTYKKKSGNAKITVAKNGKVTVKKGLKKGTYKIAVVVKAAGNSNFEVGSKTVTFKVIVK